MAEFRPLYVFPALGRSTVHLSGDLLRRVDVYAHAQGWTVEQALRFLLAYAAEDVRGRRLLVEECGNELTAARNELWLLQQRAMAAEDTIQTLKTHLSGLEALIAVTHSLCRKLTDEQSRLRQRLEAMAGDGVRPGIALGEEVPEAPPQGVEHLAGRSLKPQHGGGSDLRPSP